MLWSFLKTDVHRGELVKYGWKEFKAKEKAGISRHFISQIIVTMKLLRSLGNETLFLLNTACLTGKVAQVEDTCTTHFTSLSYNHAFNER